MRMTGRMFIALLVFVVAAACARGQCVDLQATTVYCGGPDGCHSSVAVNTFITTQYGVPPGDPIYVTCCQQQIPSQTLADEGCPDVVLRNPAIQAKLADIETTQPLLVANCAGRYEIADRRSQLRDWNPDSPSRELRLSVKSGM